jgi:hypothetical protein
MASSVGALFPLPCGKKPFDIGFTKNVLTTWSSQCWQFPSVRQLSNALRAEVTAAGHIDTGVHFFSVSNHVWHYYLGITKPQRERERLCLFIYGLGK